MNGSKKKDWILVRMNLQTREFNKPRLIKNAFIWIRRMPYRMYSEHLMLHKYILYSRKLEQMLLKEGNFTCIELYDFCKSIGCGTYYSIRVEIADKNNQVRSFYSFGQQEQGIINALGFLRTLNAYWDWNDYDSMREAILSAGYQETELDNLLEKELRGLGIGFRKKV